MFARLLFSPDAGDGSGDEGQTVVVGPNDSILSIAKANGFFFRTVWNHPKNAALKEKRKDPEILMEGDEVYVPKPEPKKVSKPDGSKHKFKLKGEKAKFKIRLKKLGKPRANEEYILVIDGALTTGTTDGKGKIECDIPNDATGGSLKLKEGKEEIPIAIGRLDPADSASGVRQRLEHLGLNPGDGSSDEMPAEALKVFQAKYKLEPTGKLDDACRAKLKEVHPA